MLSKTTCINPDHFLTPGLWQACGRWRSMHHSRGCPFQCEFCGIIELYGRVARAKTTEQVLNELSEWLSLGWRGKVFIVDDNLLAISATSKNCYPNWLPGRKPASLPASRV